MRHALQTGDKVKMLPEKELLELFERRNFFSKEFRPDAARQLSGTTGTVDSIEQKYANDYFFYRPEGAANTWSVPVQAVDYDESMKLNQIQNP